MICTKLSGEATAFVAGLLYNAKDETYLNLFLQGLEFTTTAPALSSNGPSGGGGGANLTPNQCKETLQELLKNNPKSNEPIFDWIEVSGEK